MTVAFRSERPLRPAAFGSRGRASANPDDASSGPPEGFLPLPLDLVTGLPMLPFDVYLVVGRQPVLYARRDADPFGLLARIGNAAAAGLVVRSGEGAALRATLLESLAASVDVPDGRSVADPSRDWRATGHTDRAGRIAALTAALLEPVLGGADGIAAAPRPEDAVLAAAAEAARLAASAVCATPPIAGRLLARPRTGIATRPGRNGAPGVAHVDRAIDAIALATSLARVLGIDPLVAAEAAALRDLGLAAGAPSAGLSSILRQRRHPLVAADLVRAAGRPAPVVAAIAAHHERLDGSGQPAGLGADDLGPTERLLALVDTLVAMTRRDGGSGLPIGEAFRALRMAVRGRFDGRSVFALAGLIADGTLGSGRADPV